MHGVGSHAERRRLPGRHTITTTTEEIMKPIHDNLKAVRIEDDETGDLLPLLDYAGQKFSNLVKAVVDTNKSAMSQADFAAWIEDNLADIAATEGMPTGGDMLAMSLGFERTSEKRLKSKVNLQSGSFRLEYIDDEDKDTRTSMEVFSRFSIGIPVFENSTSAYQIDARLKYRESSGKVSFWFELIRPDKAFRQAVEDELGAIAGATGLSIINGKK